MGIFTGKTRHDENEVLLAAFVDVLFEKLNHRLGEIMADITNLKNEVAGLTADQAAFNAKVDADLAAIQAFIASLQGSSSSPSQADLDALQQQVAAVRAGLVSEQAKVDAAVPAAPATPAA